MLDRTSQSDSVWRHDLLKRLRLVVLPVWALSGMFGAALSRTVATRWLGLALMVAFVGILVSSSPRRSYRTRAWSIISTLLVFCAASYLFIGFNPGTVLSVAFCLVLTALLLGRTVMITQLALISGLTIGLAGAIELGFWSGPPFMEIDASDPIVWVRVTIISVMLWSAIAFSVLFVVNTNERTSMRHEAALEETRQALRRLQAESKARLEAETVAAQAQKIEALGQLAAGVAHDFNNALLVVKVWTEILAESKSEEDTQQGLQAIGQATQQAEQLARQLLTFGRKEVRSPRYLPLDEVVENAAGTLRRVVPSSIRMNVETQSEGAAVFADETQIHQLLFNLVINARDAIDAGGEIRLRTHRADDATAQGDPEWVVLEVEDNGVGMDEDTLGCAAEPFFTTKAVGAGTGLGLSTVVGIAQQSGGRVDIDSTPGKGTRVAISLPRTEVAVDDRGPEIRRSRPSDSQTARVLVLEDDPLAHDLIVFSLKRGGFAVLDASDGNAAVRLLESADAAIDVLCTDAVFPGAPLREVIEAFEANSPNGRIVVCSGYVPEELARGGADAGIYEYLPKPFTARELIEKIESILASTS